MSAKKLRIVTPGEKTPAGDGEEFVALMTAHQTSLLAYLLSLVPNKADAEDILQKTNIVLWRKRESFELGTSFRAWAFTVARWEARAFMKERGRKSWLVYDDEVAQILADRIASVPGRTEDVFSDALNTCLGKLSEKNRTLVIDRYQQGLSFQECAEKTGRTEGALRVTLHRIRTSLRRCIVKQMKKGAS